MATFGYTRVSTIMQVDSGVSLEQQAAQLSLWAQMHGASLAAVYSDPGVSGSMPIGERPAGAELLAKVDRGDTIIVCKLDRAFRSALDALETIRDLHARGVDIVLMDISHEPLSTSGMGKLVLTIMAAVAENERDRIRERILTAKRHQREQGLYLGGRVLVGHVVQDGRVVAAPRHGDMLAIVRRLQAEGASLRRISAELGAAGFSANKDSVARLIRTLDVEQAVAA